MVDEDRLRDLRLYASYSPAQVVLRYSAGEDPEPPSSPETYRFPAAIGFVDVSGFTALSEKLSKEHGRKGAELLNQYINSYFELLIKGISSHSGDVIKFAGDALQVVWRNRTASGVQHTLAGLVMRASKCCLDLLDNLNEYSPVEGVVLRLHMGIGAGMLDEFYVGGHAGKWEYFVAGEPIEQMSDATEEATHGQLVLSKHSYQLLLADAATLDRYHLSGEELESTQYRLDKVDDLLEMSRTECSRGRSSSRAGLAEPLRPTSSSDLNLISMLQGLRPSPALEKVLRCFVPALIEERVAAGQVGAWVSEHRKLVSVFMKVVGLGLKNCEVADKETAHCAVSAVQLHIKRHDGTITRLITDDKGTRFLIAFGLPGHANEDDERRAVLSSLEVVDSLSEIDAFQPPGASPDTREALGCAIGITTGRVFCGEAGSEYRREYTLAGAKVNLAARLMQAVGKTLEKGVFVDDDTYNACQMVSTPCSWEVLEPIKVKGKEERVVIHRPWSFALEDSSRLLHLRLEEPMTPAGEMGMRIRSNSHQRTMSRRGTHLGIAPLTPPPKKPRRRATRGRVHEQEVLREGLQSLNIDQGGTIMLLGEAGMGKTHLVDVLRDMKRSQMTSSETAEDLEYELGEVGLFLNASKPIEHTTPFFMWRAVFERIFTYDELRKLIARSRDVSTQKLDGDLRGPTHRRGIGQPADDGSSQLQKGGQSLGRDGGRNRRSDEVHDHSSASASRDATMGSRDAADPRGSAFEKQPSGSSPECGAGAVARGSCAVDRRASTAIRSSVNKGRPSMERRTDPHVRRLRDANELMVMWLAQGKRTDGWPQKWRDAYSTVQAFQLPSYIIDGRHCVRPQATDMLLADDGVVQLAPLLSPVLPLHIEDNDVTKHMSGESRLATTIQLMVTVLAAKLRHGRTVLVFEDVHWMDSSSWALLRALQKVVQPMLVLLTLRPLTEVAKPAEYIEMANDKSSTVLELQGLAEEELRGLLCEELDVKEVPEEMPRIIRDKSAGNPFWTMEFVKSMREECMIATEAGRCLLLVSVDKIELPSSVEALVTSRMDRLPAGQPLLMKMGSVMGIEFSVAMLAFLASRLHMELPADVEGQLASLCATDMLTQDVHQGLYSFKHRYLQEVSYTLLPEELKEKLHRASAEFYEAKQQGGSGGRKAVELHEAKQSCPKCDRKSSRGSRVSSREVLTSLSSMQNTRSDELIWKLSYHWSRAGMEADAVSASVRYLTLAGDRALENFSLLEARKLHSQALALAMRSELLAPQRGPLQRRMAHCHKSVGELKETREQLQQALISLGAECEAVAHLTESQLGRKYASQKLRHRLRSMLPHRQRGGSAPPPEGPQHWRMEQAIAYELLAQVCMEEHQRVAAGYCAMRSLNLGLSLSTLTPVVARSYASLLLVEASSYQSSTRTIQMYKRKALKSCELLGELGSLSYTLLNAGVQNVGNAMWAEAVDNLSRAAQIAEQLKNKKRWEEAVCHKAHLEFYRGNFALSRSLYGEASSSAESRDDKQIMNRCKAGVAAVLLAMDEVAGALDILKTTNSYGQLALGLLRSGLQDQALEKALKVKDRFKGKRTKYYVLKAFSSTAEVILQLLEDAVRTESTRRRKLTKQFSLLGGFSVSKFTGNAFGWRDSSRDSTTTSMLSEATEVRLNDRSSLEELAQEWTIKLEEFGKIYPVARPRAALLRGQYLMLNDKQNLAHSCFRRSLTTARTLQMPYEEGLALYELGKASKSYHEATRYIQHALKNFELVGAAYDVGRCKRQQARFVDGKVLPARVTDYRLNDHRARSNSTESEGSDVCVDVEERTNALCFQHLSTQLPTVGEEDETTSARVMGSDDDKTSHMQSIRLRVSLPPTQQSLSRPSGTTGAAEVTAATPPTPPTAAASSTASPASDAFPAAHSPGSLLPQPAVLPRYRQPSFDSPSKIGLSHHSVSDHSLPELLATAPPYQRLSIPAIGSCDKPIQESSPSLSGMLFGGSLLQLSETSEHPLAGGDAFRISPAMPEKGSPAMPERESAAWDPQDRRSHGLSA